MREDPIKCFGESLRELKPFFVPERCHISQMSFQTVEYDRHVGWIEWEGVPGLFELLDALCDYLRFMEIVDSIKTFRQEHRMYVRILTITEYDNARCLSSQYGYHTEYCMYIHTAKQRFCWILVLDQFLNKQRSS